jgi:isochorismate pyruvate lyase
MTCESEKSGMNDPEHCQTMEQVRAGVDDVDRALVALLQRRFGYMDAAARIKQTRDAVRDEARKQQVIANVRAEAKALGLPEQLLAQLWDGLVEGSIAYELGRWDSARLVSQNAPK